MINDITDILNFRYSKKYLRRWWWREHYDRRNDTLLRVRPKVCDHFKLVKYSSGEFVNSGSMSRDVLCVPGYLSGLYRKIQKSGKSFNNLVVAGGDKHLSSVMPVLEKLGEYFEKIYYEAKDVECEWVQTIPMGMITAYMLRSGGNETILPQINKHKQKTKLLSTAFGSKCRRLTQMIPDRNKLRSFMTSATFMDNVFCEPQDYYSKLCDYKFFASPLGNGVQTPKICECIMCETVPVVTDHVVHRELRDIYKLPILIVDEWAGLTVELLNEQWDSIYSTTDWSAHKDKLLVKNFNKLLI